MTTEGVGDSGIEFDDSQLGPNDISFSGSGLFEEDVPIPKEMETRNDKMFEKAKKLLQDDDDDDVLDVNVNAKNVNNDPTIAVTMQLVTIHWERDVEFVQDLVDMLTIKVNMHGMKKKWSRLILAGHGEYYDRVPFRLLFQAFQKIEFCWTAMGDKATGLHLIAGHENQFQNGNGNNNNNNDNLASHRGIMHFYPCTNKLWPVLSQCLTDQQIITSDANSPIQSLTFDGFEMQPLHCQVLGSALQKQPMQELIFHSCKFISLNDQSSLGLLLFGNKFTHIVKLSMVNCRLNDTSIQQIVSILNENSSCSCCCLEQLDLSDNSCRSKGLHAIATLLSTCQSLTVLKLKNQIKYLDDSNTSYSFHSSIVNILGPSLQSNKTLTKLDLSGNNIQDEIEQLIDYLQYHPTLKTLGLQKNKIDGSGITAIAAKLACPKTTATTTCCAIAHKNNNNNNNNNMIFPSLTRIFLDKNLTTQSNDVWNKILDILIKNPQIVRTFVKIDNMSPCKEMIEYYQDINFGGKRLLRQQQQQIFPISLWAFVLERAGSKLFANATRRQLERRASVVYGLLNGGALIDIVCKQ